MILGLLFLLGAGALFVLAWRQLRRARAGGWAKAEGTRLLVTVLPGRETPSLVLEGGGATLFGPVAATWDPPRGMAGVLGYSLWRQLTGRMPREELVPHSNVAGD